MLSIARGGDNGTRIKKYRPLVISLVRQRKEQHSLAHLYCTHKAFTYKRLRFHLIYHIIIRLSFVCESLVGVVQATAPCCCVAGAQSAVA